MIMKTTLLITMALAVSLKANAQIEGLYTCIPGISCEFREILFSEEMGKLVVAGSITIDSHRGRQFLLISDENGKAKGTVQVPYRNGVVCSYAMTIEYARVSRGLKVMSLAPMSYPLYYQSCPNTGNQLAIHSAVYLDDQTRSNLGIIEKLVIADSSHDQDHLVMGSWFLNEEGRPICTDVGIQSLNKVEIDCNQGVARVYQAELDSKDLDRKYGNTYHDRICFHYPQDLVNDLVEVIHFKTKQQCQTEISRYKIGKGYFSYFYYLKSSKQVLPKESIINGSF